MIPDRRASFATLSAQKLISLIIQETHSLPADPSGDE